MGVSVEAVDNLQSEDRTLWVGDTLVKNGEQYLREKGVCKDDVLLLMYPIVNSDFTSRILNVYKGDTICVAGTQNRSRYTALKDRAIDEYINVKNIDYVKTVQLPLPLFAENDEALYIFKSLKI